MKMPRLRLRSFVRSRKINENPQHLEAFLDRAFTFLIAVWVTFWSSISFGAASLENTSVKNADDLAKCFEIQPYVVQQDHAGGATKHWVDEGMIASGCTDKAVSLAAEKKGDTKLLQALAEEVRRGSRPEMSLKVFRVAAEADKTKAICDDSELYSALMRGLSHPVDYPSRTDSYFKSARAVIEACLPSKQFVADLKEDAGAGKPYISENLCSILKERKLMSSCKGGGK